MPVFVVVVMETFVSNSFIIGFKALTSPKEQA